MDNRHLDGLVQAADAQCCASLSTPVKFQFKTQDDLRFVACPPYGSPISGLCSGAVAGIGRSTSSTPASSHHSNVADIHQLEHGSALRTGPLHQLQPLRAAAGPSTKQHSASPLSWTPGSNVLNSSTRSMPELWQNTPSAGSMQYAQDSNQLRDQSGINRVTKPMFGWSPHATSAEFQQVQQHMQQQQRQPNLPACLPSLSVPANQQPEGSSRPHMHHVPEQQGHDQQAGSTQSRRQSMQGQHQQQGQSCSSPCSAHAADAANQQPDIGRSSAQRVPMDMLLSPLLPSADEGKLLDRLSQLRTALDEQRRLAASWEQQAVTLQQAVTEGQQEGLALRGQLVSLQQNIHLLGGNLQGRLSLVQGAVLVQMQTQLAEKDAALAASEAQIAAFQAQLSRLSCGFEAKLAAEQTERERLGAEAAQARLLCMARGRQLGTLQQELQQLQEKATQQQQGAAASANLQQQQLESLRQQLQDVQHQLEQARGAAADAVQLASAAEGAKAGLRQQVDELTSALAEKQLQIEWLEGKVADLEGSDLNQQFKRHSIEISRLQQAAAAERQVLEQQLTAAQQELAQLQQADREQQQRLEALNQGNAQLQQQLAQQQDTAAQQVRQLEGQVLQAEAEVQQLQAELEAVQLQLQMQQDTQQQTGRNSGEAQQSLTAFAAAAGPAAAEDAAAAAAEQAGDSELCKEGGVHSQGSSRCPSDAASALEHALRAQLGMANAEVARLQHELDVARTSVQQERQLTGQEILRLQQELSDVAASASGASCGAVAAGPASAAAAAAAGDPDEVTSAHPQQQQQASKCSWHSVHYNPAFEQHRGAPAAANAAAALKAASCSAAVGSGATELADDQAAYYEARLQDQAETISSLQQQLKQQQQLLASLQRTTLPELRVHDSAASRSSWVDILDLEDEPQQQHQQPKSAAVAVGAACADAAVQTDDVPTDSAGSTAAMAAAGATAAAVQDEQDVMSPHRRPSELLPLQQQQQQQSGTGPPGSSAWCADEGAAGSALLSAARQEIQRLQELNHQLLQSHAQELKSSVSFDAARRAVSEAKAHTKAKAAALLQASNASWTEKYNTAKAEQAAAQAQLQQLQQQAEAERAQYQAAVQDLQLELGAAQQRCQEMQEQLISMVDSHAQEIEQMRMDVEAEAAAAILDAGAAAARRSIQQQQQQQQQHISQAVQTEPLQQQDSAMQTIAIQDKASHVLLQSCPAEQQPAAAAAAATAAETCDSQRTVHLHQLVQQQQRVAAAAAERPSTPQPAVIAPTVAAAVIATVHSTAAAAAAAAAVGVTSSPGTAAAAETPDRAGFIHSWHASTVHAAGDDDMCRMSSVSDTPASVCSRLSRLNSSSRGTLNLPPLQAAAAAEPLGSAAEGSSSSTGEYQDCSSGENFCYNVDNGNSSGSCQARPDSASPSAGLPELATAASPVGFSNRIHQHRQQQQHLPADPELEEEQRGPQQHEQPESQSSTAAQMANWQVELMQQQAQLDLLKLRLSQQQKQQRLHNVASGTGSSSRTAAGRSYMSGFGTPPAVAAGNRANALLAAAAAAGAAGFAGGSSSAEQQRPESPLVPAAGGSSPMTLQQRRQQQQQQGTVAAAAGNVWSYASAAGRPSQSPRLDSHSGGSAFMAGLADTSRQQRHQQQQPNTNFGAPVQPTAWQPGVTGTHGQYDSDKYMTPDQLTPTASPATVTSATRNSQQADIMHQQGFGMAGGMSAASSTGHAAGSSSGTSCTGVGSGVGLAQLGQDVLGALSLSRYHRERSKEQEARAKQHALNAQDALDRAAAVRITRLSSGTAAPAGAANSAAAAAAAGGGVSPRYSAFGARH